MSVQSNQPINNSQPAEFLIINELKQDLGKSVFDNAIAFMDTKINEPKESLKAKKVTPEKINVKINGKKTNIKFNTKEFLAQNISPSDMANLQKKLDSLTNTQKAALNVSLNICLARFKEEENANGYVTILKKVEKIEDLTQSKFLLGMALKVLEKGVFKDEDIRYLCDKAFLNAWQ